MPVTRFAGAVFLTFATAAAQGQMTRYIGTCDASAAVGLGSDHFVVGDDEQSALSVYRVGDPTAVGRVDLGSYLGAAGRKEGAEEIDIEGAARIGDRIYWIASHGTNGKGQLQPSRRRFFATTIVENAPVPSVQPLDKRPHVDLLEKALAQPKIAQVLERAATLDPESEEGLSIEGLAATPRGELMIGFRNPRPQGQALILPLRNPAAVLDSGAEPVFGDMIRLDLGKRGIRSIEWSGTEYWIVGGPHGDRTKDPEALSFELFKWSGPGVQPVLVPQRKLAGLNPEALFKVNGSGRWYVLSDDGDTTVEDKKCKSKKVAVEKKGFRGTYVD